MARQTSEERTETVGAVVQLGTILTGVGSGLLSSEWLSSDASIGFGILAGIAAFVALAALGAKVLVGIDRYEAACEERERSGR